MADILTAEQQAAVENRGRSLLVSAAAGSGKTKVLVERLFSYVESGEANLDDFLIITYTRAAAAELRGKIAKVLGEKLQEDPLNAHLQRQLLRVYRADIKTVDAFCTALLRENCHLLREDARGHALRPDFRVLDENEAQLLRERVLARTLDEFYETMRDGDGASLLADTLGAGRDDRALGALVLELHGKLQAQPYMDRWLASQEQLWHDLPPRVEDTVYGTLLLSMVRRKALHCAALLRGAAEEMTSDAALADKYAPLFLGVAEQFALLAASAEEDWDAAAKRRVDFPRLTAVRKCGDEALKAKMQGVWNGCKKTAKGFDEVFSVTSAEAMEDLRAMTPAMLALLKLTADFSRAYQEEKRRRNAADFSDQEHEAIDLLLGADGQPTDLARTVSQRYREIMVDEYQDTNEVQNCIFSAISREGKNLFTVGDVKQSIYRFRLADPRIFLDHYLRYPHAADAAEGESAKLLLSKNFRSRDTVLDAANFVFRNVLSREMGELDYGEDESLHVGASYPENPDCCTEFHFVEMSAQESDTEKLRAARAEASFVADYIQRLIAGGFTVQDDKTHEPRTVREEDIVILMRSPGMTAGVYQAALQKRGIACDAGAGGDLLQTAEVEILLQLLQIIDNPRRDIPLAAAMASPVFGFAPEELARIRAVDKSADLYTCICAQPEPTAHLQRFTAWLTAMRQQSRLVDVPELLQTVIRTSGLEDVFAALPDADLTGTPADAEIVIGNPPMEALESNANLRLLQLHSAGTGRYPELYRTHPHLAICCATGAYGHTVAEHMFASLLCLMKHLNEYAVQQQTARWKDLGAARSIRGANVLVIGLGDIGGAFARMCRALGAAVTGIRRTPAPDPETADRVFGLDQLDALLPSADVVACALPETPQTRGLLNKARLALLKPDAYLVNAGRGSLIDEAALLETLNEGRLAGVALDVLCTEPLPADSPLWHAPRILITPHVAGGDHLPDVGENLARISLHNIRALAANAPFQSLVDPATGYRRL